MLGKLMKYEWRGLRFPLLVMFAILFGTTILTCGVIATINPRYDDVFINYSMFAFVISIFLYYFGIIGCTVGITLIVAIRFYKTCYTDQGYLTHTLPVSPYQLLNAKLITAVLSFWLILAGIVATLFIIGSFGINHITNIMVLDDYNFNYELSKMLTEISMEFKEEFGISFGLYMVYMLLIGLITSASGVVTAFGCISLGQLYAKHRIVGAIAAYFAVQIITQLATSISLIPMYSKMANSYSQNATPFSLMSSPMIFTTIFSVILAVVMYFVNIHMMTKRLNLE